MGEHRITTSWFANGQFKAKCSCGTRLAGGDRASAVARHERESKEAA